MLMVIAQNYIVTYERPYGPVLQQGRDRYHCDDNQTIMLAQHT
jgi:hypothetical protein